MLVQFSFVREEKFKSQIYFPKNGCNSDSTKDCTVHGPFYFKEIFAVKFPVFETKTNPRTGARYKDTEKSDRFLSELETLGKLPVRKENEFILLKAYV